MDENAEQMRERHAKELQELQSNCPHKEISDWMPYMWAPGHYGPKVKICKHCEKIVEQQPGTEKWIPLTDEAQKTRYEKANSTLSKDAKNERGTR